MPFPGEQNREYHELKRRQGFLWVFLALVVLMMGGILALVVYGVMSGGSGTMRTPAPVVAPSPKKSVSPAAGVKGHGDYFLTGELFASEKKYRIFKVYYPAFSKEEFFAVPWRNTAITPAVAQYGDYLAVFSEPGSGIFINKDGKVASVNDLSFSPPYVYFAVSPDGKTMVYFRYLSSVGTTSLTVRSMEKNEDAFGWPVGSSASEPCDFRGWSADGAKAYCVGMKQGVAAVKAIDVHRYVVSTVASVVGARSAEYYPDLTALVVAEKAGIVLVNTATGEKKVISDSSEAKTAENAVLSPDGKAIAFTANGTVYAASTATGEQKKISEGMLVGITPDSRFLLLKGQGDGKTPDEHYSMITLAGEKRWNLYSVMSNATISQFLGWFFE